MQTSDDKLVSQVLQRISARSWKSNRRRSYLERLATLAVGSKVRVRFTGIETAACSWKEDRGYHEIQLRSDELKLNTVDEHDKLDSGTIHTLTQEGFVYHELGHVLITDFDAWMDALSQFSSLKKKAMAKQILNAVEDVVLEAWIRDYFNCGKILDFKNQVKFHSLYSVHKTDADAFYAHRINDQFDALLFAVETQGRYDAGIDWDRVSINNKDTSAKDEAREVATQMISDAVTEPDARKRYEGILDKFDELIDARTDDPNEDEEMFSQESHEGEQEASQIQIQMMIPQQESGDESGGSGESDEESEKGEQEQSGGGVTDGEEGDEEEGTGTGGDDEELEDESDESEQSPGGAENEQSDEELVESLGSDGGFDDDELEQMVENSDVANEDVSEEEAQEHAEAIRAAGAGEGEVTDETLSDAEAESEWEQSANQLSRHIERIVGEHLRRERKTEVARGQDFGDFDSSKMVSADRGSTKVFKRNNNPGEKEYHTVLIMDDSGSMGGGGDTRLKNAAIATAALTRALEKVGIDVTVYRFARNVRLVKSANQTFEESSARILENRTYGGTCLLPALENVSDIAEKYADETFMMTITDGMPRKKSDVKKQLQQLDVRSMCLQIDKENDMFEDDYDGFAYVNSTSQIRSKTESLFRRVVL